MFTKGMPGKGMPMKKPSPDTPLTFDDPADDEGKPPHAEPDGDETDLKGLFDTDVTQDDSAEMPENRLQEAFEGLGIEASEDQIARIEAILKEPQKPAEGGPGDVGIGAKKPTPPPAGKVPASLPPM